MSVSPSGKAGGHDGLMYEHLKYGGTTLADFSCAVSNDV